jgi:hypothetical protein
MASCEGYTYLLAAEDVVPIVFGGIGFVYLAKRTTASIPEVKVPVFTAAALLVVGSAIAGPIRKAIIAGGAGCEDLGFMQIPFFCALPIGFAMLFWAVLSVLRERKLSFAPFAVFLSLLFAGAAFAERSIILIGVGGIIGIGTGILCAILARRDREALTSALFVLYAIATLGLPILGANEAERAQASMQWAEQLTNTVAQGLFALATYRLYRAFQRDGERPSKVEMQHDA